MKRRALVASERNALLMTARAFALARVAPVLGEAGFAAVELAPVPDAQSHAARRGKEWLGTWRLRWEAAAPRM